MIYENIFTIPDNSLFKEGSLDPMGTQSIWSAVGQKIFQNKLNTISTDIRNYSINLFNHYLIRKVFTDHYEWVSQTINHYHHIDNEFDFKAALVLALEDIITGSLVYQQKTQGNGVVSIAGILGSYKAELKLGDEFEHQIILDKSKGGFLVRQLSLGVNGRYKGPFMNMNLLSRDLRCNEYEWQKVDILFSKWNEAKDLIIEFLPMLKELFGSLNKDYPSIEFSVIKNNKSLQDAIVNCFGHLRLDENVKSFWEAQLGLDSGAVKALYDKIDPQNNAQITYQLAIKGLADEAEKQKLQEVIDLESFLAPCTQVFYLMTQKSVNHLSQIKDDANELKSIIKANSKVDSLYTSIGRLRNLIDLIMQSEDGESLLRNISLYHHNVSQSKGTSPWIHIKEDGTIERMHYVNPRYETSEFTEKNVPWYNDYYISTLKAISNGLNGTN